MASATQTGSQSITVTGADVRMVMADLSTEIRAIVDAAHEAAVDFDVKAAMLDLSILVLNSVVSLIHLQGYLGKTLVVEYRFVISGGGVRAFGPAADAPPLIDLPAGARIRLVTTADYTTPAEVRVRWLEDLGWVDAEPLDVPQGCSRTTYGAFASGGFGVERQLLLNPRFDVAVARTKAAAGQGA